MEMEIGCINLKIKVWQVIYRGNRVGQTNSVLVRTSSWQPRSSLANFLGNDKEAAVVVKTIIQTKKIFITVTDRAVR